MKKLINLKETIERQPMQSKGLLKAEPKSQKQQIKELLLEGYELSKQQILKKVNCWNSGEAIRRLRNEGLPIKTRMEKHCIDNKYYAVYYLDQCNMVIMNDKDFRI